MHVRVCVCVCMWMGGGGGWLTCALAQLGHNLFSYLIRQENCNILGN